MKQLCAKNVIKSSNIALNLAPFGRWTLRDKAAQRRLALRVRRAWRVTSWVKVLWPGFRRAEGKEKGKGVVVRWGLKEVQSETAGR